MYCMTSMLASSETTRTDRSTSTNMPVRFIRRLRRPSASECLPDVQKHRRSAWAAAEDRVRAAFRLENQQQRCDLQAQQEKHAEMKRNVVVAMAAAETLVLTSEKQWRSRSLMG